MKKFNDKLKNDIISINIKLILNKFNLNIKYLIFILNFIKFLTNQIPFIKIKNNKLYILVNINKYNFNLFFNRLFFILSKKLNIKLNNFNINNFINNNLFKYILIYNYSNINNYINIYIKFNKKILFLNIIQLKNLGFKF